MVPRLLVFALSLLALTLFGPPFLAVLRPQPGHYPDFSQEWLSARNYWSGYPVYEPQQTSAARHTGDAANVGLPWNAHPPVAVLVALPVGLTRDYTLAHFVWSLVTIPMFGLSVWAVMREWKVPFRADTVALALALTVTCYPVVIQVYHGQLNFVLLPLLVLGWVAERRARPAWAGVAFGLAAAVKLFPAFLFLYFVCARRWRAVAAGAAVFAAANAAAAVVLGFDAYADYVREVIPSLRAFRLSWRNSSYAGFWARLTGEDGWPTASLIGACSLVVCGVVGRLSHLARTGSAADVDRALGAAVPGMLLVSPLLWSHAFVLLLPTLVMLWARLGAAWQRVGLVLVVVVLWLPEFFFLEWLLDAATAQAWVERETPAVTVAQSLVVLAPFHYAVHAVFLLAAFGRFRGATG